MKLLYLRKVTRGKLGSVKKLRYHWIGEHGMGMESLIDNFDNYQSMMRSTIEIHHYKSNNLESVKEHSHNFYELFCLLSGEIVYTIEDKTYELKSGDILLIPEFAKHNVKIDIKKEGYERIVLWINPWYLKVISTNKTDLTTCFGNKDTENHLLSFEPTMKYEIIEDLKNLIIESNTNRYGKDVVIESILKQLLVELNRHRIIYIKENLESKNVIKNVEKVLHYVNEHYSEDISLEMLSDKFFISKYHLSREFSKLTGVQFQKYVAQKRLTLAKKLLISGEKPTNIYTYCGFKNYASFFRAFKQMYGISPKEIDKISLR